MNSASTASQILNIFKNSKTFDRVVEQMEANETFVEIPQNIRDESAAASCELLPKKTRERYIKVKVISVDNGNLTAEMKVAEEHTNIMGGLHGGFSATIVDLLSSVALMSHKNGSLPSVSVDLHLTYLKGAKIGDEITIDAKTIKTGKNLAFLEVLLKDKSTGDLLVKGSHTKYFMHNK